MNIEKSVVLTATESTAVIADADLQIKASRENSHLS